MWGIISTVFLGIYCLMSYYIGRRGWTALGRSASAAYRKLYWGVFGLLVLAFPASELGEDFLPAAGSFWLTIWGGYSMVAVVYFFLILVFIDIIRLMDKGIGFIPVSIKENRKTPHILGASVLLMVIFTLFFGSWNARNPIVTSYELTSDKKAGPLSQLRIAMVSDVHYGAIINASRLNRMVTIVNELKPDLILFAGDIIEGTPSEEEARQLVDIFSRMRTKYGIFAVPGNHDRALREGSLISRYFQEAGVAILKDDYIKVGDNFYVIGRDNPSHQNRQGRKELEDIMKGIDLSLPLILLDHQPIGLDEAQESGVDLQVSGHTHRGQIFPSNFITGQIYDLDWGLLKKEDYHLVVSSGYGTWGPPMRIGNRPEVVSVTINFK